MRSILKFLKTTMVGGIFFLLPLILIIVIFGKALKAVTKIVEPVARLIPFPDVLGVKVGYLITILLFVVIGFFSGLLAQTRLAKRFRESAEKFLDKIPGYSLLRVFAQDVGGDQGMSRSPVGIIHLGKDHWQWCFIIERHENGYLTIFIPGSPKPNSGSVRFLPGEQVKEINVSMATVFQSLTNTGVGSSKLLEGHLKLVED